MKFKKLYQARLDYSPYQIRLVGTGIKQRSVKFNLPATIFIYVFYFFFDSCYPKRLKYYLTWLITE